MRKSCPLCPRAEGPRRSLPTSRAADRVAEGLGLPLTKPRPAGSSSATCSTRPYHTLRRGEFWTGSDHIREKDGVWAVLFWLNILAARSESVEAIVRAPGRSTAATYYTRHDFRRSTQSSRTIGRAPEGAACLPARKPVQGLTIESAEDFSMSIRWRIRSRQPGRQAAPSGRRPIRPRALCRSPRNRAACSSRAVLRQWARTIASTLSRAQQEMFSRRSTAQTPSFSRMWSEPVPKLSSAQSVIRPRRAGSEELPAGRGFVSGNPKALGHAIRGPAGGERAGEALQPSGIAGHDFRISRRSRATLSLGVTKNLRPMIMLRSPSPSEAAPKAGAFSPYISATSASACTSSGRGDAAEIGQRRSVDDGSGGARAAARKSPLRKAGDCAHRIEAHAVAGLQPSADTVEVEQRLHQRRINR